MTRAVLTLFVSLSTAAVAQGQEQQLQVHPDFQVVQLNGVTPRLGGLRQRVAEGFSAGDPVVLAPNHVLMVFPSQRALFASFSTDGGESWIPPSQIEANPDPSIDLYRCATLRTRDGTVLVFYIGLCLDRASGPEKDGLWLIKSTDDGRTWGGRRRIWKGYTGMLAGALETPSGRLLLPFSRKVVPKPSVLPGPTGFWFESACIISDDAGETWQEVAPIDVSPPGDPMWKPHSTAGALEPTVVSLSDGRLLMLIRARAVPSLWQSHSVDNGSSWSKPVPMDLELGCVQYITRLASGRLVWVRNPGDPHMRQTGQFITTQDEAVILLSDDDGATWSKPVRFAWGTQTVHHLIDEPSPGELLITMPQHPILLRISEERLARLAGLLEEPAAGRKDRP
jgi:hypothetical protein